MYAFTPSTARFLAFCCAALVFLFVLKLSLLAPLYSGLLTYALVTALSGRLAQHVPHTHGAKVLSAWIVAALVAVVLVGIGLAIHAQVRNGFGLQRLLVEMSKILSSARIWLPHSLSALLPEQSDLLKEAGDWLKQHAALVGAAGLGTLKLFGYIVVGILLGAMIGVSDVTRETPLGPASRYLMAQVIGLREAFWQVATAQLKISALNTLLTAIYLVVALPIAGIHLPFTKTLLIITFVAGLLPVLGNLVSNTVMVVISLSASLNVALASLIFLVAVHKLEYFANARIVGGEIKAKAWEILLCMLVMERIFGIVGVIAGPVFYAWMKSEWHRWDRASEDVIRFS
ncbi:AI-2E family transporter [Mangrovitalea sediminis]|uniref:AI-2E family transporter n=1 Tax=Mangrovitalea sediminis TaxID=1982043 RepID=UPI000BE576D0|nr:AI-2E family transporter [Mangrovitalea sediminis]